MKDTYISLIEDTHITYDVTNVYNTYLAAINAMVSYIKYT